jgi:hypothetical protein
MACIRFSCAAHARNGMAFISFSCARARNIYVPVHGEGGMLMTQLLRKCALDTAAARVRSTAHALTALRAERQKTF